jgi:AbrB family looped-hinge helix DNA binding protein
MEENMQSHKYVRVQEKGQVTLPAEVRRKLGLKKGDLVAISETPEGVLITPSELITRREIADLDELLKEQGITFEELIEAGRELRGEMIKSSR